VRSHLNLVLSSFPHVGRRQDIVLGVAAGLWLLLAGVACNGSRASDTVNRTGAGGGTTAAGSGGNTTISGSTTVPGMGGATSSGGQSIPDNIGGEGGRASGGVSSAGGNTPSGGSVGTNGSTAGGVSANGTSSVGGTGIGGTSKPAGGGETAGTGGVAGRVATGGTGGTRSTGGIASSGGGGRAGNTAGSGGSTGTGGTTGSEGGTSAPGSAPVGDGPIGFAAISADGLDTTTGGKGGKLVTASTFDELHAAMDSNDTLIILISGSIDLGGMTPLRSNKTLIGQKGARLFNGGFEIYKRQNIIIRNIVFADGTDDTMKINQNTHHVWVDHCDFTNAADGLFDITRQSSNITVSYNHFYKHSKTMLIGHSDSQTDDTGYLKTTIHHNWFEGTEQRHPRVRFGEVHVFNNYFLNNGLYGVASTMEADVVMEGNLFEGVAYPSYVGYQESGPGDLVERNNVYVSSGTPQTRGTAFDPSTYYKYTLDDPSGISAKLKAQAGAGVLDPDAVLAASR
jgi:pectate lyase